MFREILKSNVAAKAQASDQHSKVTVQKLSNDELKRLDVLGWPIWKKEVSRFPWSYDKIEECYFLEGEVTVETDDGERVSFGKGDFVTLPKGLSCIWNIRTPVVKHYHFR